MKEKTNQEKASVSLKKILAISLIFLILAGMTGVMATNAKLNSIKIILANGYEMTVLSSNTKVEDILRENHIVLADKEIVTPDKESEISDNKTIKIVKNAEEIPEIIEEENTTLISENILDSYNTITEKVVTQRQEIPYETITKDVSNGSASKQDRVVQKGVNGIKEVTYRIKYQNEQEIEKTEISSVIIKEPVNKIVEVRTQQVTSRSSVNRTGAVSYSGGKWSYSADELDLICAITAQECNSSYIGALAVITTACNRAESSRWGRYGSDPLSQYKARGQFCYSIDSYWKKRLNGNYPDYVQQAVLDALNGKRNHRYLSFRAAGYASGETIGGNVYFNAM